MIFDFTDFAEKGGMALVCCCAVVSKDAKAPPSMRWQRLSESHEIAAARLWVLGLEDVVDDDDEDEEVDEDEEDVDAGA